MTARRKEHRRSSSSNVGAPVGHLHLVRNLGQLHQTHTSPSKSLPPPDCPLSVTSQPYPSNTSPYKHRLQQDVSKRSKLQNAQRSTRSASPWQFTFTSIVCEGKPGSFVLPGTLFILSSRNLGERGGWILSTISTSLGMEPWCALLWRSRTPKLGVTHWSACHGVPPTQDKGYER